MDTTKLKSFAQGARAALLKQITIKLQQVLAVDSSARREAPDAVDALEAEITSTSQDQVLEKVAYTWFNRFCALRFMDANGYNRIAVVSPLPDQFQPEILAEAKMGLIDDALGTEPIRQRIHDLLAGKIQSHDAQSEAYRLLLVAACNSWHSAMPFMFEKIEDYTELLMPADLLSDASILSDMRTAMTDEVCENVECIGWLYQFYISEKKDEVIGKVVKSEDIPAATQLFTPNWIVKYMVQNSLGAQWLATYPQSPLKGQMAYYIEPAEQTDEVNAQLAAITPNTLNPEELTLIDPASGSGHILVEAYELFKAIYLERGYQKRDVPQLILEKNLFGLDIDERAAQLTGFALMMKGRADDRRLFERGVKLNVMALVDSAGFDAEALAQNEQVRVVLADYGLKPGDLTELKNLFEHATTFGSLIQVPEGLAKKLPALKQLSESTSQDLFVSEALKRLGPLVQQAELLAAQYDAVVANPPYMTSDYFPASLKKWVKAVFAVRRTDLYALFIERALRGSSSGGRIAIISRDSWMFLPTYEALREQIVLNHTILSMAHLGSGAFESIGGQVVRTTVFNLHASGMPSYRSSFYNLVDGDHWEKEQSFLRGAHRIEVVQEKLGAIPGYPMAFDASDALRDCFEDNIPIGEVAELREGIHTGHNDRFMRYWWEISIGGFSSNESSNDSIDDHGKKWIPYNKGGAQRKWYGNNDYVLAFDQQSRDAMASLSGHVRPSQHLYFLEGGTWTDVGSGTFSVRYYPAGFLFDGKGMAVVAPRIDKVLGAMNSKPFQRMANMLMPTLNYKCGTTKKLPYLESSDTDTVVERVVEAKGVTRIDWDAYERSWDFRSLPLLTASTEPTPTLESSYTAWITQNKGTIAEMKRLEEENNRLFIDAYGLADELTPDVPIEQITLTVNPAYRYSGKGGKLDEAEQWTRFRQDTMEELVSYAIGCMMGRYSLDAPGLIYAHSGNEGFDPSQYTTLPADDDAIIPILEGNWFTDDIVERMKEFLKVTFGTENYEENLRYLEDGLYPSNLEGKKRKGIRDYFLKDFYNKHVQTYKKRPIYWLFSSPKGSFNALVYLHRYKADTVSVVLNDYLREFKEKLSAKLDNLQHLETSADASKKDKTDAIKEITKIKKILVELNDWERDVLFPLAQKRQPIDLDDGVKHNYNLFGKALKKVTGLTGK